MVKKKQSFFARLFGKSKEPSEPAVEQVQEEQTEEVQENNDGESDEVTESTESNESDIEYNSIDDSYVKQPPKIEPSSIQVDPVDPSIIKTTQDRTYSEITASIQEAIEEFEASRNSDNSDTSDEVCAEAQSVEDEIRADIPEEAIPVLEEMASNEDEYIGESYVEQQVEEPIEDVKSEETEEPLIDAEPKESAIEEKELTVEDLSEVESSEVVEEPKEETSTEEVIEEVQETVEPEFTTLEDIKSLSERYNGVVIDGLTVYNEYGEKRTSIKPLKTELIKDAAVLHGLHVYFGSASAFSQVMQISDMMKIVSVHVKPTEVAGNLVFEYELIVPNAGAGDVLKAMTNVLIAGCPCLSCVTESNAKVNGTKISVSVSFDATKMTDALGARMFSMSKVIRMIEERVK